MYEYFCDLAEKYNMTLEGVLSIAINRYGVINETTNDKRIRFNLSFTNSNVTKFFAVCVNTYLSTPFKMTEEGLYLENIKIGDIHGIEKDTCTETYFRNNKKSITFNSNSRSKCVGCKFCGTYSLSSEDNHPFNNSKDITEFFDQLLKENNIKDASNLENVTICTGCFETEDDLIKHLIMVERGLKELNFNGSISYIGSQLRDYNKIKELIKEVPDLKLLLTIEKFLNREDIMKKEKSSLTLDKAKDLLNYFKELGMQGTFLYILGLEDLETVETYFNYFKDSVNKFPTVQVFQDYTSFQEKYRCKEAKDFEYYLKARELITDIFSDTNLYHEEWESYRSLCYDKKFVRKKAS